MLTSDDFRDLVLHFDAVEAIEADGAHLTLHMRTARGAGCARIYVGDLEVSEARSLVEAAVAACPFAGGPS